MRELKALPTTLEATLLYKFNDVSEKTLEELSSLGLTKEKIMSKMRLIISRILDEADLKKES